MENSDVGEIGGKNDGKTALEKREENVCRGRDGVRREIRRGQKQKTQIKPKMRRMMIGDGRSDQEEAGQRATYSQDHCKHGEQSL